MRKNDMFKLLGQTVLAAATGVAIGYVTVLILSSL